jgi:hypothetical protein
MVPASVKRQESHRIMQENSENLWNMEAVFQPEFFGFFSGDFPTVSPGKAQENDRNSPEKI